jgi:threonine/homoserine/homoserine lactone efflux protein
MAARFALRQRGHTGLSGANALTLSGLSRGRVVTLGVVAGALNPKTLPIFLTGVAAIAGDGQPTLTRSLALVLLTGTASVGVALPPLLLTVAPGTRTTRALERVRRIVEPHATVVAILLLVLIGLAYLAFGVAGLR